MPFFPSYSLFVKWQMKLREWFDFNYKKMLPSSGASALCLNSPDNSLNYLNYLVWLISLNRSYSRSDVLSRAAFSAIFVSPKPR